MTKKNNIKDEPSLISPLAKHRERFFDDLDARSSRKHSNTRQQNGDNSDKDSGGDKGKKAGGGTFANPMEQAVQFTNNETASYAPAIITVPADTMISQSAGLAAESSAGYYDGMTKMVMASQGVMLKKLTEDIAKTDIPASVVDITGIIATELLLAGAMAVAAAGGAMEATAASAGIKQLNDSVSNFQAHMRSVSEELSEKSAKE